MTGIIEHEFPGGCESCPHCGTTQTQIGKDPERPCAPRWSHEGAPLPRGTRTGQSVGDFACDDASVISARLRELEAERVAGLNRPAETD